MIRLVSWSVVLVLVLPLAALADVVTLTDGSMITGQVSIGTETVAVSNALGTLVVQRSLVAAVRRDAPAAAGIPVYAAPAAPYTAQSPYTPYANAQWPYGYGVTPVAPQGSYAAPLAVNALPPYQAPVVTGQMSTPYDQLLQVTAAAAPVRRGPGTQYAISHSVNRDDVLYRVGHTDGWYQVVTRTNVTGWINAEAVAAMGNGPDLTPYQWDYRQPQADLLVTAPTLNVRSGPGMQHPVIDSLYRHDAVKTIAREGAWVRIEYLDPTAHTGWVHGQHVADLYRYVKTLLISAQYDEAVSIGEPVLPALAELLAHEDWRLRHGATMVRDKINANRAFVPGMTSFNYEAARPAR